MRTREEGFTLIELLIAVTIMGLMMGAITSAMIVAFRTVRSGDQGVTDSTGAQLLVSYMVSDAQAANLVQPTDFTCDGSALLELRATEADASLNAANDIVYSVSAKPGGGNQLTRNVYALAGSASSCSGVTPTTQVLVLDIDAAGTSAACDTPTCTDASSVVGLTVKAFSLEPKSATYTGYTFKVQGTRRVS